MVEVQFAPVASAELAELSEATQSLKTRKKRMKSINWPKVWANLGSIIWNKPIAGIILFLAGVLVATWFWAG